MVDKQFCMPRKVPKKAIEARRLVAAGQSPTGAAKAAGCDRVSVFKLLREGAVELADGELYYDSPPLRKWRDLARAYAGSADRLTFSEITKQFRFKPPQVRKYLPLFGVEVRDHLIAYNRRAFAALDTEEAAYWYGFLLADGGLYKNEVRLKLSSKDVGHLHKYCAFIGADPEEVMKIEVHGITGNRLHKVDLYSPETVSDLMAHGMEYRKSNRERPPALEPRLARHFVRGVFDGDGCIRAGFQHLNLVGSEEMLRYVASFASGHGAGEGTLYDLGTYWKCYWYGEKRMKAFLGAMYEDSTIYLQRKYDLAKRFAAFP